MATMPQAQQPSMTARLAARAYTVNWEAAAYAVIFLLACFTRIYDLGTRAMSHDESLHTKFSWELYKKGEYAHNPMMHGPLLFHMTALSYLLFGDNDFTSRLYVAVLGIALVLVPVLFRRRIGRTAALLASVFMLISPYMVYYSRYVRHDIPVIFFTLVMLWALFTYFEDRRFRWLCVAAAGLILMLASKEVAFIYIIIIASFLLLLLLAQLIHRHTHTDGRKLFDIVVIGLVVGAVMALGLIVVLTISPMDSWDQPDGHMFRAIIWALLVIGGMAAVVIGVGILQFWRANFARFPAGAVGAIILLALVVALCGVVLNELVHYEESTTQAVPVDDILPGTDAPLPELLEQYGGVLLLGMSLVVLVGGLAIMARLVGWWDGLAAWPAFDGFIVIVTLVLPWLVPFVMKAFGYNPTDYQNFWPIVFTLAPMILLSVVVGLVWNWRWAVIAGVFYGLFFFFFTTVFTNGQGLATGMVGSLGYWLEQQGVRRGSQPQYYYVLQVLFYEFLPLVGTVGAGVMGLNVFYRRARVGDEAVAAPESGSKPDALAGPQLVPVFFGYLLAANFIAYTLAGEKMPWLTLHLTVPMIFLAAWFFARILDGIDLAKFKQSGWLLLVLALPAFAAGVRTIGGLFDPVNGPFRGLEREQLARTGEWFAILVALVGAGGGFVWAARRAAWRHTLQMVGAAALIALVSITARSAWMAAFVNYDLATEFLVYAHSAPAVKDILARIEEISLRTTDSLGAPIAYDNEVSWPYSWYFRNYTNARFMGANPTTQNLEESYAMLVGQANLGKLDDQLVKERFYQYDVIRLWWPMQDYFYVDVAKVDKLFALDETGAALRQGLFDIWWNRDYSAYARATGRDPARFSISDWPVKDRMSFFVRKDIAAQMWDYGVGDDTVFDVTLEDPYATNAFLLVASEELGKDAGLKGPRGLDIGPDGNLYVVDTKNSRVVVLGPGGEVVRAFGGVDPEATEGAPARAGYFLEPWGVAVAGDGTIFVADTWNHRVQVFSPEGELIRTWGHRGDLDDPEGFYGPREVAVTDDQVFVVDTGNKVVRVYDWEGNWQRDIGSGGSEPGRLEEPVGVALYDGSLAVADTWNRRVQVFDMSGAYLKHWSLSAWYNMASAHSSGNLPFLTLDDRGNVYIADPDTCRILVYDIAGNYRYNFGRCSTAPVALSDFGALAGMAMTGDYQLYVVDAAADRILRFDLRQEPVNDAAPGD
ncbi:MAG: TIGR03663 family protein [Anaerolineae bacterium]|nr:TIGR03663 family protein [Anaerolineae bacterium]